MKCIPMIMILVCLFALSSPILAQPPDTLWTKIYDLDVWDSLCRIEALPDNGFIIGGSTGPEIYPDQDVSMLLMKMDSLGTIQWYSVFDHSDSTVEQATDLLVLEDGRYLLAGYTCDFSVEEYDVLLVMADESGQIEWERVIGEEGQREQVAGASLTSDGGFVFTGRLGNPGEEDILLIKTDSLGTVEWESAFDLDRDFGNCVNQTSDGGYIVGGFTQYSSTGVSDCNVIKTDAEGEQEWQSIFDFGYDFPGIQEIHELQGGDFIGIARHNDNLSSTLFRLSETGEILWWNTIEVGGAFDLLEMSDGRMLVGGMTGPDPWGYQDSFIMMTDSVGNSIWYAEYDFDGFINQSHGYVCATSDGGYCLAASAQQDYGFSDILLLRFGQELGIPDASSPGNELSLSVSPNPFRSFVSLTFELAKPGPTTVEIFDLGGRRIRSLVREDLGAGLHSRTWDGAGEDGEALPSGLYLCLIRSEGNSRTVGLCLLR